jgi:hypothetical protein
LKHIAAAVSVMFLCAGTVRGQHGNEWISYSQPYWKFPVSHNGLHRISQEALQAAGFPAASADPGLIRIFFRERESRIRIHGAGDGSFDPGDYIEMLGRVNGGWLDSLAHDTPDALANPFYSMFSDTAYAFITIGDVPGLRTAEGSTDGYENHPPEPYCTVERIREYHDEYLQGKLDLSGIGLPSYASAEGWMSARFPKGSALHTDFSTAGAYSGPGAPDAQVTAVSASGSVTPATPNHHLQVGRGNPFVLAVDTVYSGYQLNRFSFVIPAQEIGQTTRITHRSVDDLGVPADHHAVAWVSLRYAHVPQLGDYAEGDPLYIGDLNGDGWIHFAAQDLPFANPVFYLTGHGLETRLNAVWESGAWHCLFPHEDAAPAELRIFAAGNAQEVSDITPVTAAGTFTDYGGEPLDSAF